MQRVLAAVLVFTTSMLFIISCRPVCMFKHNGQLKTFGLGPDQSLYSLGVVVVVVGILSFCIALVLITHTQK